MIEIVRIHPNPPFRNKGIDNGCIRRHDPCLPEFLLLYTIIPLYAPLNHRRSDFANVVLRFLRQLFVLSGKILLAGDA